MKFQLGRVLATPGALALLAPVQCEQLIRRHSAGDWGDVDAADVAANERAVFEGDRILSRYEVAGESFYVITEADRSSTVLLLRSEY